MKHILLSALLVICGALSLDAQNIPFSVSGNAPSGSTKVYVVDVLNGNSSIASGEVKEGRFKVGGRAEADALLGLRLGEDGSPIYFFNDGQAVVADMAARTVIGSSQNSKLSAATLQMSELLAQVGLARQQFERAQMSGMSRMGLKLLADSLNATLAPTEKLIQQLMVRTIVDNRSNLVPAVFAPSFVESIPYDVVFQIIDTTARYYRHPASAGLRQYIAMKEMQNKVIGSKFIDLSMPGEDGKTHSLSEYCGKGKYVLIDFWASWCGPCRMEMPNVVAAYNKYKSKGFDVVGLSFDSSEKAWRSAITALQMPWVHMSDLRGWDSAAARTYGIRSIPSNLLVDPQGRIVAKDLRGQDLLNTLARLLGK